MKRFRSVLFWSHLVMALVVGVIVVIMSATGVALTYQKQMQWWADTRGLDAGPPEAGAVRLDAETLIARVSDGDGGVTSVTWRSDPAAPAVVSFGRTRTLFVSSYTGAVLGEGSTAMRGFFRVMTDWHRWLARTDEDRAWGRSITGAANLGFLFIVLSGMYLWLPRKWSRIGVRNITLFRRDLSPKARDFNWHNVIGFWSAIPLAVVVASATVISYPWATDLAYRIAGDVPPSAAGPAPAPPVDADASPAAELEGVEALPLAALVERASGQVGDWRSLTLQVPESGAREVDFSIDSGTGGQPQKRAQLTLGAADGAVVAWEPFSSGTSGRRFRSILRFAHTGEVAGLTGQTIAGLVTLGSLVLVWTGIALSLRRLAAWIRRRGRTPSASDEVPPREELVTTV